LRPRVVGIENMPLGPPQPANAARHAPSQDEALHGLNSDCRRGAPSTEAGSVRHWPVSMRSISGPEGPSVELGIRIDVGRAIRDRTGDIYLKRGFESKGNHLAFTATL
jgi:hypothetical protein